MSWYALTWTRSIFPTAGRSDQVIFGLRDKARSLRGGSRRRRGCRTKLTRGGGLRARGQSQRLAAGPAVAPDGRRCGAVRASRGSPAPNTCRSCACSSRRAVRVPSSFSSSRCRRPSSAELLSQTLTSTGSKPPWPRRNERCRRQPGCVSISSHALNSSDCFFDFVHLNMQGRSIATPEFLEALAAAAGSPMTFASFEFAAFFCWCWSGRSLCRSRSGDNWLLLRGQLCVLRELERPERAADPDGLARRLLRRPQAGGDRSRPGSESDGSPSASARISDSSASSSTRTSWWRMPDGRLDCSDSTRPGGDSTSSCRSASRSSPSRA